MSNTPLVRLLLYSTTARNRSPGCAKRLEEVFRNVSLAHDVVAICIEISEGNTGDFSAEIAHVLRRCAADKLRFQMEVLTKVIERLGSTTAFSNADTATSRRVVA